MATYTIKDLEKLSQVKAHTIRIWEKRYKLLSPERTDTNIRRYSDDDLRRLLNVALLNAHGLKISKIASLSDQGMRDKVTELSTNESGSVSEIESLIVAMIELDETRFEKVINGCILHRGFEDTMLEVIQPFLQRVGVLWRVDAVKPGQEHFISNLIRQKVITAIDGLLNNPESDARTIILFLPEDELHELGLLFAHYLARKSGYRSIYLGQNVPHTDLIPIGKRHNPDLFITGFLGHLDDVEIRRELDILNKDFPNTKTFFFCHLGLELKELNPNQHMLKDLRDLRSILQA